MSHVQKFVFLYIYNLTSYLFDELVNVQYPHGHPAINNVFLKFILIYQNVFFFINNEIKQNQFPNIFISITFFLNFF